MTISRQGISFYCQSENQLGEKYIPLELAKKKPGWKEELDPKTTPTPFPTLAPEPQRHIKI